MFRRIPEAIGVKGKASYLSMATPMLEITMLEVTKKSRAEADIEILPPPRCARSGRNTVRCLCCQRLVEVSAGETMEYGICNECIERP